MLLLFILTSYILSYFFTFLVFLDSVLMFQCLWSILVSFSSLGRKFFPDQIFLPHFQFVTWRRQLFPEIITEKAFYVFANNNVKGFEVNSLECILRASRMGCQNGNLKPSSCIQTEIEFGLSHSDSCFNWIKSSQLRKSRCTWCFLTLFQARKHEFWCKISNLVIHQSSKQCMKIWDDRW